MKYDEYIIDTETSKIKAIKYFNENNIKHKYIETKYYKHITLKYVNVFLIKVNKIEWISICNRLHPILVYKNE